MSCDVLFFVRVRFGAHRKLSKNKSMYNFTLLPRWFSEFTDPDTLDTYHTYHGGYWESKLAEDFSTSPNIF